MVNLGRYLASLAPPRRRPGGSVRRGIGRLPFAMNVPLSVILLMREEGYSTGRSGWSVGAEAWPWA